MQDPFASFFQFIDPYKREKWAQRWPLRTSAPILSGEKIFISYNVAFDTASASRLTFLIKP